MSAENYHDDAIEKDSWSRELDALGAEKASLERGLMGQAGQEDKSGLADSTGRLLEISAREVELRRKLGIEEQEIVL